jgi:uncharacterized delta-60 repeat protein
LVEQPDGKLLIACETGNGFAMVRVDQFGVRDTGFGFNVSVRTTFPGSVNTTLVDIALQPDGKIVAVGDCVFSAQDYRIGVARYNPDGTLDSSFSQDGIDVVDLGPGYEYASSVAVLRSGAIVVGGNTDNGFDRRWVLVGYRGDGSRNTGFGTGGVSRVRLRRPTDELGALVAAPDGSFFAAGAVSSRTGSDPGVAHFRPNGSVDLHWGAAGLAIVPIEPFSNVAVTDLALRPDGKLVLAGSLSSRDADYAWAARLDVNGSADAGFGDRGRTTVRFGSRDNAATGMALTSDGGVVLSGYVRAPYQPFVSRLTGDAPASVVAVGGPDRCGIPRRTACCWPDLPRSIVGAPVPCRAGCQ